MAIVAISSNDSDDDSPNPSPTTVERQGNARDCAVMRRAIQEDKRKRNEAGAQGNSNEEAYYASEVEKDARAARSISGCDISDLVGANVGQ